MKKLFTVFAIAACAALLGTSTMYAQQQPQDQNQQPAQGQPAPDQGATKAQGPIPAYRSPLAGAVPNEEEEQPALAPDTRPVTGIQNLTLGMPIVHSYWQPHFDLTSTLDSNPAETINNEMGVPTGWGTWISVTGGVDVHRVTEGSDLELTYVGGGTFTQNTGASNGVIQQMSFTDKYSFRRWNLSFVDDLNYLPETAFGYAGQGNGAVNGGGGNQGGTGQDLLTGRGENLGNTFQTEADILFSSRSSMTLVGGFSNLDYFDSDLLNYQSENFRAGYNYILDRKNTVGAEYNFGQFNYSNFHQSITTHTAQLVYGRRITGKLAFQVAAGPEISFFQTPITPAGGEGGTTGGPKSTVGWALNTNLQYQLERTAFTLSFVHGVNGGSGIQAGAETDTASGTLTRRVTRAFTAGITGGYTRSSGLTVINTTTPFGQTFDYWYGGGNLSYALSRMVNFTLAYQLQYQDSGLGFCLGGATCGTTFVRHTITFGFTWRDRPLLF